MSFKVGDKITIRTSIAEWREIETRKRVMLDLNALTAEGRRELKKYKLPLTITSIEDKTLYFKDINQRNGRGHEDWFMTYKENTSGYYRDSEGFLTNKDNWKPGALGIL